MAKHLTADQLTVLRAEPLTGPNKISLALRLLNMTQREFAPLVRMHPVALNKIASRGADIRLSTARRIADAIGAGIDDIFPPPMVNRRKGRDRRTRTSPVKGVEQRSGKDRRTAKAELPATEAA